MNYDYQIILFYVFVGSAGALLIINIFNALTVYFHKKTTDKEPVTDFVSIVIAARNERKNLQRLIPAMLEQTYQDFELIICLDRCSDGSLDFMKSIEKTNDKIRTLIIDELPEHFSPKKYALTLGIKGAKADWIIVTDADCLPASRYWLENMVSKFDPEADFVLGLGPYDKEKSLLNKYIQFETFLTGQTYLASSLLNNPYMGIGRNMAFRRTVFLENNGYNKFQGIMGGDDDLFVHYHADGARTEVLMGEKNLMYSSPKVSFSAYWKQKIRHFSVGKYYKASSRLKHTMKAVLSFLVWISFVILAFGNSNNWILLSILAGYLILRAFFDFISSKRMGFGYNFYLFPILEIFHTVFVPVAVTVSNVTNKIRWK